jgi:hypothetical protein
VVDVLNYINVKIVTDQDMKNTKMKKQKENEFIPLNYPLVRKIHWWRKQSMQEDKGGSFDVQLYMQYCEAKFQQI